MYKRLSISNVTQTSGNERERGENPVKGWRTKEQI
jgi:hypothetical protein